MRAIAYKGEGSLILAIFVRTYYEDDPPHTLFCFFLESPKAFSVSLMVLLQRKNFPQQTKGEATCAIY